MFSAKHAVKLYGLYCFQVISGLLVAKDILLIQ